LAIFVALQTTWVIGVNSSAELTVQPSSGQENTTSLEPTTDASRVEQAIPWQTWSAQAVKNELAKGRPAFVDYTAAWCLSCQFNKLTFQKSNVQSAFKAHHVALFRADWTRQDPAITQSLNDLGRNGVPVYILLKNGQAPHFLSEFVTEQELLKALEEL
jgi:thiol:disulfide interchange protein DsbD